MAESVQESKLSTSELSWAAASLCQLHQAPFSVDLVPWRFTPPYRVVTPVPALQALGFEAVLERGAIERGPFAPSRPSPSRQTETSA